MFTLEPSGTLQNPPEPSGAQYKQQLMTSISWGRLEHQSLPGAICGSRPGPVAVHLSNYLCSLQVGLGQVLELVGELLQYLQTLLAALVHRAESVWKMAVNGIKTQAAVIADLRPVRQVRELPAQIQQLLRDLQELTKILLQLVINTTPLYNMVSGREACGPHGNITQTKQEQN